MLDYINTNTFRDFADFVMMDNKFDNNILSKNAIIYCKRDFIDSLFDNIKFSKNKYILITHASDYPVGKNEFDRKPNCVRKWYAENITYDHQDLIGIPIGLTPNKGEDETPLDLDWFITNINRLKKKEKDLTTLYCNWYTPNNLSKRGKLLNILENNNIDYLWDHYSYSKEEENDAINKVNLFKQGKISKQEVSKSLKYYEYCENMAECKFVVSPPGNGEDCHRTWEALYMGCTPIVIKSAIFNEFKELPIIQVNNYSEVTYDLLHSYLNKEYNYEKLNMEYWKNRIKNDLKTL